ncbi:hypothetical protein [Marinobacterium aestuariivivens]|uniref:Transposase DDE domain-containing protein n=1 Tax=Marinobacterium aestuariivivens TaxID=1698799 RepID=A0ABW1ZU54_9GAMM
MGFEDALRCALRHPAMECQCGFTRSAILHDLPAGLSLAVDTCATPASDRKSNNRFKRGSLFILDQYCIGMMKGSGFQTERDI